jgi:cation diffusion facilitator CzcD-associated flavoprotein CzcO
VAAYPGHTPTSFDSTALGCKRIVFDPGYVEALNGDNIELEWDPIAEIVSDGIVTKSGMSSIDSSRPIQSTKKISGKKYDVDIICYATGFDVEGSYKLNVQGINGQTMQEYFASEGGPTAYMGTMAPGFPNWATIFGPNMTTGEFWK